MKNRFNALAILFLPVLVFAAMSCGLLEFLHRLVGYRTVWGLPLPAFVVLLTLFHCLGLAFWKKRTAKAVLISVGAAVVALVWSEVVMFSTWIYMAGACAVLAGARSLILGKGFPEVGKSMLVSGAALALSFFLFPVSLWASVLAFVLVQFLYDNQKEAGTFFQPDRFQESARTAQKILKEAGWL